jgi:hypothetical protein
MLSKLVIQAVWVRKSDGTPEHKWLEIHEQTHKRAKERGDKESLKGCIRLKSCEPLYTCTRPPFIGRRRDFYSLKLPSDLKNIPNRNMHMNAFYISWLAELISDIYKSVIHSHLEPGLSAPPLWLGPVVASALHSRRFTGAQIHVFNRWNHLRNRVSRFLRRSPKFPLSWNNKQTCEFALFRRSFRQKALVNFPQIIKTNASLGFFLSVVPSTRKLFDLRSFEGAGFYPIPQHMPHSGNFTKTHSNFAKIAFGQTTSKVLWKDLEL